RSVLSLEVPGWITDRFSGVGKAELQLQKELPMRISSQNLSLDTRVSGCSAISHAYTRPVRGFSVVADLLTKKRKKLQIVNWGDLTLRLTSIEPKVKMVLSLSGFQAWRCRSLAVLHL
ncbi:hypothetical protein M513_06528, partial [Trichuris suis]